MCTNIPKCVNAQFREDKRHHWTIEVTWKKKFALHNAFNLHLNIS